MTATDPLHEPEATELKRGRFGFRAKFILVVGSAVFFDLMLTGGIALWNVGRLSRDASGEIEQGLTQATTEYLDNYLDTTGLRVEGLIDNINSEVATLAGSMQELIDAPRVSAAVSASLDEDPRFNPPLVYSPSGNWAQSPPGSTSVTSVWGYLLQQDGSPLPEVKQVIDRSAPFDLFAKSMLGNGPDELQIYYIGPKSAPIFRTIPYTDQAQTFDRLYPGHNEANFWTFFFPGLYEGWEDWAKAPDVAPANLVTQTTPYVDAITGNLIVSFFHPLWTRSRNDVAGAVGVDVTLEQMSKVVEDIQIAQSGFAVLATSTGNILAINPSNEPRIGLSVNNAGSGSGVTQIDRSLAGSSVPGIASLTMPSGEGMRFTRVTAGSADDPETYIVGLKSLAANPVWDGTGIGQQSLVLGFFVPEEEVYASLDAAKVKISDATGRIIRWQAMTLLFSMLVVLTSVFAISGRITAGLSALAAAARRLSRKDYDVQVHVGARDEVGEVANAFNIMAEEVRFHTEHLEQLVEDRTRDLEAASAEILSLNEKLEGENLRLSAEVDVARRVQMMVLPHEGEIRAVPGFDIAAVMEPADEVGGDYYDVLQFGDLIKIGIGDVTGHGLESGVFMLMVQSIGRALLEEGVTDPREFLAVLNRAITKNLGRSGSDKHMTLAFLDIRGDEVMLTGQHEEVLVARLDGTVERIDTMELGFPVGMEDDIADFIASRTIPLAAGETLVLFTDGITEAENMDGVLYGDERFCEVIAENAVLTAEAIRDAVMEDVRRHIGAQKVFDDITLVVIKKE